jgi:rare lipoprotein A
MPAAIGSALLALVVLLASGCASTGGAYKGDKGHTERGLASWYGPGFHGKTAADGSTYDMHKLTAAHRTLPFDTVVQVRNRDNGRRVQVRITDRGPFVRGRIIDLSYEAAKQIDMIGPGLAPVEIRVVSGGPEKGPSSDLWIQAGAFKDPEEARTFYRELREDFANVRLSTDGTWHRVRLGPFDKKKEAQRTQRRLESRGIDAFLTRL